MPEPKERVLARIESITQRIAERERQVSELLAERDACYVEARSLDDPPTYRALAAAAHVTEQGVHKAFQRMREKGLVP